VKSDYESRGRIYLPLDEMREHDADEGALDAARITPEWKRAIAAAVARTRALFDDGLPLCDRLQGRLRYEIRLTWLGGTSILDRIEAAGFDVLSHRPAIGAADMARLLGMVLGWPRSIQHRAARV
jgi:phytoene synthase